jgi:hypothetical protein
MADPSVLLFHEDRALGQHTGGVVSLVCAIPIMSVLIFMTVGCLGIGKFKFNMPEKKKNMDLFIRKWKCILQYIPTKMYINFAVTLHFISSITGLIEALTNSSRQLFAFQDSNPEGNLCQSLCRTFVINYTISKACTYTFLGIRARLVFRSQADWQQKMVEVFTFGLPFGFFIFGVYATNYVVGTIEAGLRCKAAINLAWVTNALPGIDFLLSLLFLMLFLIPLRSLAKQNEQALRGNSNVSLISTVTSISSKSLNQEEDALVKLMKETVRMAIVQSLFSGFSLCMMAWGFIVAGAYGLFSGSFLSVDVLFNCVVQFYATRRVWFPQKEENNKFVQEKPLMGSTDNLNRGYLDELSKSKVSKKSIEMDKLASIGEFDEPLLVQNTS